MYAEPLLELPPAFLYPMAWLFGCLWGSFLNVCIARLPRGGSVVWPASHCPKCKAAIRGYDNVPVFSYLLLRGKCRACKAPISARYPMVELLMGMLTLALVHRFGVSFTTLAYFVLTMGLIVVTFIDVEYWIIPNEVSYGLWLVGLGVSFVPGATVAPLDAFIGFAGGAAGLFLVAWLFLKLRGVEGLGAGDWKLLGGLGAFLGWRLLPLLLFLAALQGVLVALVVYLARRGKPLEPAPLPEPPAEPAADDETRPEPAIETDSAQNTSDDGPPPGRLALPFGPFLAVAALELIFFGDALVRLFDALAGGRG